MGAVKLALAAACENPDWGRIIRNGGRPCFHVADGQFCLRAETWGGHETDTGGGHSFVSLFELVTTSGESRSGSTRGGKRSGAGAKQKVDAAAVASLRAKKRTWLQIEEELGISRWSAMKALKRARTAV